MVVWERVEPSLSTTDLGLELLCRCDDRAVALGILPVGSIPIVQGCADGGDDVNGWWVWRLLAEEVELGKCGINVSVALVSNITEYWIGA